MSNSPIRTSCRSLGNAPLKIPKLAETENRFACLRQVVWPWAKLLVCAAVLLRYSLILPSC